MAVPITLLSWFPAASEVEAFIGLRPSSRGLGAWCPQELGVAGRGGRGRSAQGRGQRADLGCEDPRAPRCHSLVPPEDRRTFSIIYVSTGQSQFPALHAGDFSQTLSQPEPSLWPAWRAATSFRSHSLGMAASGPKTGSPEGSSQP